MIIFRWIIIRRVSDNEIVHSFMDKASKDEAIYPNDFLKYYNIPVKLEILFTSTADNPY